MSNTTTTAITPFEPSNLTEATALAERIAKSGLIPGALKGKPDDVLVVLMTARELGVGPMTALRGIHVYDGKPIMSAQLTVALVVRDKSVCEYFRCIESTPAKATYETKRVGSAPVRMTWTIDMADRAGLLRKDNWQKYPGAMLRNRAAMDLARSEYADLVNNVYDPDEKDEIELETVERVTRTPVSLRDVVEAQATSAPPSPPRTTPTTEAELKTALEQSVAQQAPKPTPPKNEPHQFDARIAAAQSLSELNKVAAELAALSDGTVKDDLRKQYLAKKKELEAKAKGSEAK